MNLDDVLSVVKQNIANRIVDRPPNPPNPWRTSDLPNGPYNSDNGSSGVQKVTQIPFQQIIQNMKFATPQDDSRLNQFVNATKREENEPTMAKQMYSHYNPLYDNIKDPAIAFKIYDTSFNTGNLKVLHHVLTQQYGENIPYSRTLTPEYVDTINKHPEIYNDYVNAMEQRYHEIAKTPDKKQYLNGWLNRLHRNPFLQKSK